MSQPSPSNARALLEWALRAFASRIAVTVSFGGSGIVLAHMLSEIDRSVPVLFIDTGYLFPETLAFRDEFAARFGLTVVTLVPATDPGPLFLEDQDRCCHIRKVEPMELALLDYDAWVSALRRSQSVTRADVRRLEVVQSNGRSILKVHPLFDWSRDDVERYVAQHDLPMHPLTAQGYTSIGCWPCTSPVTPGEPERTGRWRGSPKTECGLHSHRSIPHL
jgi:phosphoadenosine phosphosulfate reductase